MSALEKNQSGEGYLVMIVEDSKDQSFLLSTILKSKNYRVIWAKDGQRAFEMISTGITPDVLVTDLRMPALNGFELMKEMSRIGVDIPVVITSGSKSNGDFEEAYILGAEDYLVKPYSPAELLKRLEKILS